MLINPRKINPKGGTNCRCTATVLLQRDRQQQSYWRGNTNHTKDAKFTARIQRIAPNNAEIAKYTVKTCVESLVGIRKCIFIISWLLKELGRGNRD